MQIIAHRGYSAKYPQNTLLAFQKAIDIGADAIELDIHQVGDELVVFHDFYVDKLTQSKGRISEFTLAQISALQLPQGQTVPTLDQVAQLISDQVLLNIEIKSLIDARFFVEYLDTKVFKYQTNVVISSFDHPLLTQCMSLLSHHQDIQYAALVAHVPIDYSEYAKHLNVEIAAIDCELVNEAFVNHAHRNGFKVWCYTVNRSDVLVEMLQLGVDGIFTDDPAWAKNQLAKQ